MNIDNLARRIDEARARGTDPVLLLLSREDYVFLRNSVRGGVADGFLTSFLAVPVAQSSGPHSYLVTDTFYGPEVWRL